MSHSHNNRPPRLSWWRRYRQYAEQCVTSGFVPKEHLGLQRFGKALSRLWTFIQVGDVRVVGAENLRAPGHLLFCPNHSAMLDAVVTYPLMPLGTRFMGAVEEMRGFGGLKAILMGALGCYPVDRSRGKTVIPVSIDLIAKHGKRIVMYPEGKISATGTYLEFKKGAAWIAMGAYEALDRKELVGIVPIHICYGTRDVESAGDFAKMRLRWRKGATITIGKPVYVNDVQPLTAEEVIGKIRLDITSRTCATTHLPDDSK